MSPTHARGRAGKVYRYYVSTSLQRGTGKTSAASPQRVSATALEELVKETLARVLPAEPSPLRLLVRASVEHQQLVLTLRTSSRDMVRFVRPEESLACDPDEAKVWHLTLPIALSRIGRKSSISAGASARTRRDPAMIAALRRAHDLLERDAYGPVLTSAPASQYARRLVTLALLAPDIQAAILAGRQPRQLTLTDLLANELPLEWAEQSCRFGFPAAPDALAA